MACEPTESRVGPFESALARPEIQEPRRLGSIFVRGRKHARGKQGLMVYSFISVFLASICFWLLSTFPGWHEETSSNGSDREVKPFPSRPVSQVALACSVIADFFLLVSAIWTHVAAMGFAEGARALAPAKVKSSLGSTSIALNWVAFGLMAVVWIGLLVMILVIAFLDKMTEDNFVPPAPHRRWNSPIIFESKSKGKSKSRSPTRDLFVESRRPTKESASQAPPPNDHVLQFLRAQPAQETAPPPPNSQPPPQLSMYGGIPTARVQRVPRWDGDE